MTPTTFVFMMFCFGAVNCPDKPTFSNRIGAQLDALQACEADAMIVTGNMMTRFGGRWPYQCFRKSSPQ